MNRFVSLLCFALMGAASCTNADTPAQKAAQGSSSVAGQNAPASVQQAIRSGLGRLKISQPLGNILEVKTTEQPNFYWVKTENLPPLVVSGDGQFIVQGEMMKIGPTGAVSSVSAPIDRANAKALLASIDKKDMIVFPAKGQTKGRVLVFTDVDCGYCRKLHSQINDITAKGIEVDYLAWPRAAQFMPDITAVWCSKDRQTALTQAKSGIKVEAPACDNSMVLKERQIGAQIGVQGTPAVYSTEGEYLGGYMTPEDLAARLKL